MYGECMSPLRGQARRTRPIGLAPLRGFEAAGRLLSFTLAAAELNLTQSSISRQVAALERQVGRPLFVRRTRALELTPAGERLLRSVQQALQQLDGSVDEVRGRRHPSRVTISTYASFASLWLVPRLARFQRDHPTVEIRVDAGDRYVDLEAEGVDIAIRRSRPVVAPGEARSLHDEHVTPAVSPLLLERSGSALRSPQDLLAFPLLDLDDSVPASSAINWARWFEFAGIEGTPPAPRLLFTFIDQSVQAAVRGQGVVLGRSPFIDDLAATGDLLIPFPKLRMRTGYRYTLIDNPATRDEPHVSTFRDWVNTEFARGPQRQT
jgi:LysR family transcriptional regulator, glycine cleavage system transcriptional activator